MSPYAWKKGSTPRTTLSASTMPYPLTCWRWASSARWLSITVFGSALVPRVVAMTASDSTSGGVATSVAVEASAARPSSLSSSDGIRSSAAATSGGQHRSRSAGSQQAVALVGRLVGIGRYDDEAGPQSSEVGHHPGDGVAAVETDPLTGEQTGAHEAARNRVDPTVQLGPADRADPRLHEGEPVRPLFGLEGGEQGQVAEAFDPGGTRVCSVRTKIRRVLGLGGDHGSSLSQAHLVPPASDRRPVGLRAPGHRVAYGLGWVGWR